jgi:hypothetical protein
VIYLPDLSIGIEPHPEKKEQVYTMRFCMYHGHYGTTGES